MARNRVITLGPRLLQSPVAGNSRQESSGRPDDSPFGIAVGTTVGTTIGMLQ